MSDYILYHKPTCTTSNKVLKLLREKGVEPEIRLYVDEPPTQKELDELLKKLDITPIELVRKKEKLYRENYKDQNLTKREWLKVFKENPILIERPILIKGDKAVIGRPVEKVLELL